MSQTGALPELRGERIAEDEHGNICLNDLWRLAGEPKSGRPYDWRRGARAKALEHALQDRITENFRNSPKSKAVSIVYVHGRGMKARTFAHPVLALDYAEYLEPALGVEVREIFLRYRANDVGLANDILDRIADKVREDELRVHVREEMTARNRELVGQARKAGCQGWEYAELHNSGYRGLYNGLDENGIHALKRLTKNQRILDHMTAAEGAANVFRVTQAKLRMEREKPASAEAAFKIAHDAGVRTRQAMREIGGVMPEDMPVADSIKDAKRRLDANRQLLER